MTGFCSSMEPRSVSLYNSVSSTTSLYLDWSLILSFSGGDDDGGGHAGDDDGDDDIDE